MEEAKSKKIVRNALGRGLSALISGSPVPVVFPLDGGIISGVKEHRQPDLSVVGPHSIERYQVVPNASGSSDTEIRFVPLGSIAPNPTQPRQLFSEGEINELAESIKSLGVLQPVLLRPTRSNIGEGNSYEIVAGERRWRAAKVAQLTHIPVIIKDFDDKTTLEVALVENVQRLDLNPIEQAKGFQRLVDEFGLTQQEVAERVGKDRASISNYVRLLRLPDEIIELIRSNKISMGHAKAILTVKEPAAQLGLARKVLSEGLSVRELESIVARVVVLDTARKDARPRGDKNHPIRPVQFQEVIDRMRNALATKVCVKHHKSGRGRIEIEYFSEQELDRIVECICN